MLQTVDQLRKKYSFVENIDGQKGISLVMNVDTGCLYVQKKLTEYNRNVYRLLKSSGISGIPKIYELVEAKGTLYIIEEYIYGYTMDQLYDKGVRFKEDQLVGYMIRLLQILNEVHSLNPPVIHRDIKPSNLMITQKNQLYLIDFNAAKQVHDDSLGNRDTVFMGTQSFAAPEQYGYSQSGPYTDIFALGITLNYLLTGKASRDQIYEGECSDIIRKCIKLEPSDRYQSAKELEEALSMLSL